MAKCELRYLDRCIVRTPVFPIDYYKSVCMSGHLQNNFFKEAMYIASPELSEKLCNDKNSTKITNTIYKYISRSSTRCTPFGLFAGCFVAKTNFSGNGVINFYDKKYKRKTTLDMLLMCKIIDIIEKDDKIRNKLKFYTNETLYQISNNLRYIEIQKDDNKFTYNISEVEIDEELKSVIKFLDKGLTIKEILNLLLQTNKNVSDCELYIDELLDAQILVSELFPSVVGEDPLEVLLKKLEVLGDNKYLPIIKQLIEHFNLLDKDTCTSIDKYEKVFNILSIFGLKIDPKYVFHVDLFKSGISAEIGKAVPDSIKKYLCLLFKLNRRLRNFNLENFAKAFYNRYYEQEVPLSIVLDSELGIGYPYSSKGADDVNTLIDDICFPLLNDVGYSKYSFDNFDTILLKKIVDTVSRNKCEIEINDSDFENENKYNEEIPKMALYVLCSVITDNNEAQYVHIKSVSKNPIQLLGRFANLDNEIYTLSKEIALIDDRCNYSHINMEVSHLPDSRLGNVTCRPKFRSRTFHYISNGHFDNDNIKLSDLMIKVRNNKIILFERNSNKVIHPKMSCAHNYHTSNLPVYRFLCDLQYQDMDISFNLSWNSYMQSLDYLPRVRYRNIIISRQRWRLNRQDIEQVYTNIEDNDVLSFIDMYRKARNMPSRVVILEADNELLVDFTKVESVNSLIAYMKNKSSVFVEEFVYDIVKENSNTCANEMIFFFHNKF